MRTSNLGHAAQVLRLGEPLQTILQTDGVSDGGQVQGDVPEWVYGGGHTLANLIRGEGFYKQNREIKQGPPFKISKEEGRN